MLRRYSLLFAELRIPRRAVVYLQWAGAGGEMKQYFTIASDTALLIIIAITLTRKAIHHGAGGPFGTVLHSHQ